MTKPTGWWLGLRYMSRQQVVTPTEPRPEFPEKMRPVQTVFADATVLQAGDKWKETLQGWRDQCHTLICWIPDVRYHESTGARVTREDVLKALEAPGWRCVEDELIEGHAFIVIHRDLGAWHYVPWGQGDANRCLVFRSGAFGDALMASSVLPGLKEQGYKVSFYSHDRGAEIMRFDPSVDEVVALGDKQVADEDMNAYWKAISSRFDHVVNLTNAVEGRTLPQAWHNEYYWPDDQRRRAFGGSYLADHHTLAGVPGPYRVKFYPSPDEAAWAKETADRLGPFVMVVLRGSAYYKWYPHMHKVVTQLLAHTSFRIVLAGGPDARDLETVVLDAVIEYHGTKERVDSVVGDKTMAQVMALAQKASLVIGPETGILNAVSMENVPKVCLLSHSAPSNLTDDWKNAVALIPQVPCHPCHRLHHKEAGTCPIDKETGAAACAAAVPPADYIQAILAILEHANQSIAA